MTSIRASNNPAMLVWAREEVGYTIKNAAEAIGVSVGNLKAAESGERPLTLNQLRTAAERYGCPFGYFYLSTPPHKKSYMPVPDFRIEPGFVGVDHFRLNFEIKQARDRRLIFIELTKGLDLETRPFQQLSKSNTSNIGSVVRARLGVIASEISSLSFDQVYSFWKAKIENDGVLVYESQYLPEESGVIGAAIYYDICPIILVKRGSKYNERKLFTLLHEYAHLLKGKSAINDANSQTIYQSNSNKEKLEVESNRLAAEVLVPSEYVNKPDYVSLGLVEKMEHLANAFKVTYSTAAVCLMRLRLISESELSDLLGLRKKENERKASKPSGDVIIPREILMRLDMGRPMFNVVLQAYGRGALDIYDASKILNLRVSKIDKLISGMI